MSPKPAGKGDRRSAGVRRWELSSEGYCITCRVPIAADPEKPRCRACEPTDPGRFCLACGEGVPSSTTDPVCRRCHDRLYT